MSVEFSLAQYGERERLSTGESHAAAPGLSLLPRLRSLTPPYRTVRTLPLLHRQKKTVDDPRLSSV